MQTITRTSRTDLHGHPIFTATGTVTGEFSIAYQYRPPRWTGWPTQDGGWLAHIRSHADAPPVTVGPARILSSWALLWIEADPDTPSPRFGEVDTSELVMPGNGRCHLPSKPHMLQCWRALVDTWHTPQALTAAKVERLHSLIDADTDRFTRAQDDHRARLATLRGQLAALTGDPAQRRSVGIEVVRARNLAAVLNIDIGNSPRFAHRFTDPPVQFLDVNCRLSHGRTRFIIDVDDVHAATVAATIAAWRRHEPADAAGATAAP